MFKVAKNGQKLLKIVQNCWKLLKVVENYSKLLKTWWRLFGIAYVFRFQQNFRWFVSMFWTYLKNMVEKIEWLIFFKFIMWSWSNISGLNFQWDYPRLCRVTIIIYFNSQNTLIDFWRMRSEWIDASNCEVTLKTGYQTYFQSAQNLT